MAVPYLENGQLSDARIIHLVRHPLACVRSLVGIRFFENRDNKYARFMRRHFHCYGDPVEDAMRWWVEWNLRCERLAQQRFRVEDLDKDKDRLAKALGLRDSKNLDLGCAPKNINTRKRRPLSVQQLAEKPSFIEFSELATKYGYHL